MNNKANEEEGQKKTLERKYNVKNGGGKRIVQKINKCSEIRLIDQSPRAKNIKRQKLRIRNKRMNE